MLFCFKECPNVNVSNRIRLYGLYTIQNRFLLGTSRPIFVSRKFSFLTTEEVTLLSCIECTKKGSAISILSFLNRWRSTFICLRFVAALISLFGIRWSSTISETEDVSSDIQDPSRYECHFVQIIDNEINIVQEKLEKKFLLIKS